MKTLVRYGIKPDAFLTGSLFDDTFSNSFNELGFPSFIAPRRATKQFPSCDVEETEGYFLLSVDLPGVKREDLKLEIQDKVLTLSGQRKSQNQKDAYTERFQGSFERNFALPENLDCEKIEAHYEDGVLRILLPKMEAKTNRTITISQGGEKGIFSKWMGSFKKDTEAQKNAETAA